MQLDVPLSDPPSWRDELRITLLWPKRRWSADSTLDLLSTGGDFDGWLHDTRRYDGRHQAAWLSAIADFMWSVRQIGPHLRSALGAELSQVVATAESLRRSIEGDQPTALRKQLPSRLPADRAVYVSFKNRWSEPAVRDAAWQDLQDACRDEATSYDVLALRRDLFWHLVRTADYDVERMSTLLAGVLSDFEFYVLDARRWLGDMPDDQYLASGPMEKLAGLTEEQRRTLCRRILARQPVYARRVVWIAFDRVGRGTGVHELGAVSFWENPLVCAALQGDVPRWDRIPAEFRAAGVKLSPTDLPASQDVIWARVDLGPGAFADPVSLATEQAESVVALAGFHSGELRWRRLDGYLDFVDDRLYGMSMFGAPDRLDDMVVPTYTEFMVAELDRLGPRLSEHLPLSNPDLTEVVKAVRWWQQARTQTSLAALLLDVRVLELVASRVGTSWEKYLTRHLRVAWVRRSVITALKQVVREAVYADERLSSKTDRQRVEMHRAAVVSFVPGGFTIDPSSCLEALPELASVFPGHTPLGRRLRTLNTQLSSINGLTAWCYELTCEWARLSERLKRLRNALAHGGPVQGDAVASASQFAQNLAAWSLSRALEDILEGETIPSGHDEHKQQEDAWWDALSTAPSVSTALFPSEHSAALLPG
jgi:hypothetical protein